MKVFNIVTNLTNGAGLERDYKLMRRMLESYGHKVQGVMFNDYQNPYPHANINIFLEVINDRVIKSNPKAENWFVPNSEWYYPCWNGCLRFFSKILCKTPDCYKIWSKKVGEARCVYIGFESLDFYDPKVVRTPEWFHCAGKSETKNTAAVMEAWRTYRLPYQLTAVAFKPEIVKLCQGIPNVTWIERLTDEQVAHAMNAKMFHIMPSKYEGFGHYIHEATGCGGIVVTTDAPPMNEFNGVPKQFLIPVQKREVRLEAFFNLVDPKQIAAKVIEAAETNLDEINKLRDNARTAFLADREAFRTTFEKVANA